MKSSPFERGTRFALLTLGLAASGVPLSAAGASTASPDVTAPQMIDAFEGTFGVHPGQRRNHIKGTCAAGDFVGSAETAAYSRSPLFSGKAIPVVARFSLGGGSPEVPDAAPAPRGMALEFRLSGGAKQHITMINAPIFAAASPASFRDLLLAIDHYCELGFHDRYDAVQKWITVERLALGPRRYHSEMLNIAPRHQVLCFRKGRHPPSVFEPCIPAHVIHVKVRIDHQIDVFRSNADRLQSLQIVCLQHMEQRSFGTVFAIAGARVEQDGQLRRPQHPAVHARDHTPEHLREKVRIDQR